MNDSCIDRIASTGKMPVIQAKTTWVALCALALLLGGCANQEQQSAQMAVSDYYAGNYPQAQQRLKPLAQQTNSDFVLNNVRLGSAAIASYDLDEAEAAFLRAYEAINSVGVNNGGRSLGAALVDEKIKIWKGEPFERAMANFYLGLVYYIRHDYANARGAFENALFKLRDYGEEAKEDKYRNVETDFALGYLMLAKSYQRLGRAEEAQGNFARAVQLRPDLAPLADYARNARSNLLLVVDYGYGPQKTTEMVASTVGFAPTPAQAGPIPRPIVYVDGQATRSNDFSLPPVDILALAQDRRWQSIDTIRVAKSVAGDALIGAGAYEGLMRGHHNNGGLGLALAGAGLLLKATSVADTRHWEMLPRTTYVLPLFVPPGTHEVTVDFPAAATRQTWRGLSVPENGEATYYMRMQRWSTGPFDWPPANLRPQVLVAHQETPAAGTDRISHPPQQQQY